MCREDLVDALMNLELEGGRRLNRRKARALVIMTFTSIKAAIRRGETVHFPWGRFDVVEQVREPERVWRLGRIRVLYKRRYKVQFRGGHYVLVQGKWEDN
jgi:nucleoid DNA-binding protein